MSLLLTRRVAIGVLLAGLVTPAGELARAQSVEVASVSLVQLIAAPAQFDGKRVAVAGYCTLEFEGNALYLHEEDFRHNLITNAVKLAPPSPLPANFRPAHRAYASVEGVFVAPRANAPGYRGTIRDITRVELIPAR